MEVNVNVNRLDLFKMQFILLFRIGANYVAFGIVFGLMAIATSSVLLKGEIIVWFFSFIILGTIVSAIMLLIGILIQTMTASAEKGFIGNTLFKIEESGFYEHTEGTETKTNWVSIAKLYKSKNYIYVRISAFRIHIVPKRAFSNENEFNEFYNLIKSKMEKA